MQGKEQKQQQILQEREQEPSAHGDVSLNRNTMKVLAQFDIQSKTSTSLNNAKTQSICIMSMKFDGD
jgi:hypothetical protein